MKLDCLRSKAFQIVLPILITTGIGIMAYAFDQMNSIEALAQDNRNELVKRELLVYQTIPKIDSKVETISENIIKLCVVLNIQCK